MVERGQRQALELLAKHFSLLADSVEDQGFGFQAQGSRLLKNADVQRLQLIASVEVIMKKARANPTVH